VRLFLGNKLENLSELRLEHLLTPKTFNKSTSLEFKDPRNLYLPADDPSEGWCRFAAGSDVFDDKVGVDFGNNKAGSLIASVEKWLDGSRDDVDCMDWIGGLGVGLGLESVGTRGI